MTTYLKVKEWKQKNKERYNKYMCLYMRKKRAENKRIPNKEHIKIPNKKEDKHRIPNKTKEEDERYNPEDIALGRIFK